MEYVAALVVVAVVVGTALAAFVRAEPEIVTHAQNAVCRVLSPERAADCTEVADEAAPSEVLAVATPAADAADDLGLQPTGDGAVPPPVNLQAVTATEKVCTPPVSSDHGREYAEEFAVGAPHEYWTDSWECRYPDGYIERCEQVIRKYSAAGIGTREGEITCVQTGYDPPPPVEPPAPTIPATDPTGDIELTSCDPAQIVGNPPGLPPAGVVVTAAYVQTCTDVAGGTRQCDYDYTVRGVPGTVEVMGAGPLTCTPPLTPTEIDAVEQGADGDLVEADCDAVVAPTPELAAKADAAFGPMPETDAELRAELAASTDMLDQYLLAATGYDPGVPAQREAFQTQMVNASTALQTVPAGGAYAASQADFAGAARAPSGQANLASMVGGDIGGGEPGSRCRSTFLWAFIFGAGTIFTVFPTSLGAVGTPVVFGAASAGAFYWREQYESRMRQYNAGNGALPYSTVARRELTRLLGITRAYLAGFLLPDAAPAQPMQADDWQMMAGDADVEVAFQNPMDVNAAGQAWQAGLNQQAGAAAPDVLMYQPQP